MRYGAAMSGRFGDLIKRANLSPWSQYSIHRDVHECAQLFPNAGTSVGAPSDLSVTFVVTCAIKVRELQGGHDQGVASRT
jgi:hypothetical protein